MKPLKEYKYPNLLAEIKRRGETQEDVGKILNLSATSICFKLSDKSQWKIDEIKKLCEHYEKTFEELFK